MREKLKSLNLRIVGRFAQYPPAVQSLLAALIFWTDCDSFEKLPHIYFGLDIKEKIKTKKMRLLN